MLPEKVQRTLRPSKFMTLVRMAAMPFSKCGLHPMLSEDAHPLS